MRLHPLAILLASSVKPLASLAFYWTKMSMLMAERMMMGTKMRIMSMTGYLKMGRSMCTNYHWAASNMPLSPKA